MEPQAPREKIWDAMVLAANCADQAGACADAIKATIHKAEPDRIQGYYTRILNYLSDALKAAESVRDLVRNLAELSDE